METTTETTNGSGTRRAKPTAQTQVPGTEGRGSKKLLKLHEAYATAKYEAKAAQDEMKELGAQVLDLMRAESVDTLRAEIDVGDTRRACVTEMVTKEKLKSRLEKEDDD